MNSQTVYAEGKDSIEVHLTPDEALALTGVEFNGNPKIKTDAQRKIRSAFEKDICHKHKVNPDLSDKNEIYSNIQQRRNSSEQLI